MSYFPTNIGHQEPAYYILNIINFHMASEKEDRNYATHVLQFIYF